MSAAPEFAAVVVGGGAAGCVVAGSNLADHPGADVDIGYAGPARATPLLHTIATFHSADAPTDGPPDLMLWVTDPLGDPAERLAAKIPA